MTVNSSLPLLRRNLTSARRYFFAICCLVAMLVFAGQATRAAEVVFIPVGFLSGDDFSEVRAVNDDVTLAGCLSYHRDPMTSKKVYSNAARWTPAEGMQPLPLLPDTPNAQANPLNLSIAGRDLSNNGSRILYDSHVLTNDSLAVGIADADGSNLLNLTALPNGDKMAKATQLSDDGATAFGYRSGGVSGFAALGAIWTASEGVQVLVPPVGFAEILPVSGAISADGLVSAGILSNSDVNGVYLAAQAYRWTPVGGVQGLGYLPGDDRSQASALSADGGTILGSSWNSSGPSPRLFLWTESNGMMELSSPQIPFDSDLSGGTGISADSSVLMVSGRIRRRDYAYYFPIDELLVQAGAASEIDGWSHFVVVGLTDDGRTVWGSGTNPAGKQEGFIAQFAAGFFDTLVAPLPQITSPLSAEANVNSGFSYIIEATGFPETFSATDLPEGLTFETTSLFGLNVGIISGTPAVPGIYTIPLSATNVAGTDSATLTLTVTFSPATPRLLNISTRTQVLTGDNVLIAGFIIPEGGSKQVVLRAIGPSLADFGVNGALLDPTLELHYSDGTTVPNDDWQDTQKVEIEATGLQPSDARESAIIATLEPGLYTAIVRGSKDSTGVGLVEVYDLDDVLTARMANISTRGFIETGDNVLIGGIIVGGGTLAKIVVRALGSSLADVGVTGALADTTLEIHGADGSTLFSNDDWREMQETEIEESGLAPTHDDESAIIATLPASNYTAIVRGKDGAAGVGLVEVYNVD